MDEIERRRSQRLQFMNELYDIVEGSDFQFVGTNQVAQKLGFNMENQDDLTAVLKIARYLEGEGLVRLTGMAGSVVSLTHKGVVEVEEARSQPDQPTDHFAPINVVYANTITNSPIQQGSPKATQSLTVINQSNLQELETFVQSLKKSISQLSLSEEQQAELEADIQTIEAQSSSPKPKQEVIKAGLQSIKGTLGTVTSTVATSELTRIINDVINNM